LRNKSLKAHYKVGNIFVGFFWQPGVKGCLEVRGSNPWPSDSQSDAMITWPRQPAVFVTWESGSPLTTVIWWDMTNLSLNCGFDFSYFQNTEKFIHQTHKHFELIHFGHKLWNIFDKNYSWLSIFQPKIWLNFAFKRSFNLNISFLILIFILLFALEKKNQKKVN